MIEIHPNDLRKVFAIQIIVRLKEYFAQSRFTDRIVFGIEFIETMERVTILHEMNEEWENNTWVGSL